MKRTRTAKEVKPRRFDRKRDRRRAEIRAPRCGLCGRRCVEHDDGQAFADHGLCASCLTGTGRKTA